MRSLRWSEGQKAADNFVTLHHQWMLNLFFQAKIIEIAAF